MRPHLADLQIIIPMMPFAVHRREVGQVLFVAGWMPTHTQIIAIGKNCERIAIPLPNVSVADRLPNNENTRERRLKLWTRLTWDELTSEKFRCERIFLRGVDDELHRELGIKLDFIDFPPTYDFNAEPLESKGSCDLSEECLGSLTLLTLERMG